MEEVIQSMVEDTSDLNLSENDDFLVLSNSIGCLGACAVLYQEELSKIADKLNSDFYIIPSSIHEMLIISANSSISNDEEYLKYMICDTNKEAVSLDEILSDNLYFYNRSTKSITIV